MQESIKGISNFEMDSIGSYNKLIGKNLGNANFEQANENFAQFQNILNDELANLQTQDASKDIFNMGVSMDEIAKQRFIASQEGPSNKHVSPASPLSNLANSLNSAFEGGLNGVNQKQIDAERAVETLASGGDISVHEVMIASEKAGLNMQMAIQLRNKMISAYNELYQMRF